MTKEDLIKANEIKKEIDQLECFIRQAERTWQGKIIKKETKYIFKSMPYGVISSAEYEMNTEIKNKVLNILREHLQELKS